MPTSLVGVNTGDPNKLVRAAISDSRVRGIAEFDRIRSEVKYGRNSRIDLLLEKGVEILAYDVRINLKTISLNRAIPPKYNFSSLPHKNIGILILDKL